jgi:hypothetical protein
MSEEFERRRIPGEDLDSGIEEAFRRLREAVALLSGRLIDVEFPLGSLTQLVSHGLGRLPLGFIVAGADSATTINEDVTLRTTSTITLTASGAAGTKIWVY